MPVEGATVNIESSEIFMEIDYDSMRTDLGGIVTAKIFAPDIDETEEYQITVNVTKPGFYDISQNITLTIEPNIPEIVEVQTTFFEAYGMTLVGIGLLAVVGVALAAGDLVGTRQMAGVGRLVGTVGPAVGVTVAGTAGRAGVVVPVGRGHETVAVDVVADHGPGGVGRRSSP